jgi:hypothetical protein
MPIINQSIRTVACDNPACDKTVIFDATNGLDPKVLEANPWLRSNLAVQTADSRMFSVCSTLCLVEVAKLGKFDPIEPKQIQETTGGTGAIALAAAEARRKQLANDALKKGEPVKLALS